jgi:thiol-disulfide isomerase/thioredoxin
VVAVRAAIAANDLARAEQIARNGLAAPGAGPRALEALSWVARGALAAGDLTRASRIARETQDRAEAALKTRALDAEPSLPLALGAALEVQAQALAQDGARSEAVALLTEALERYGKTSIHQRIQKNIHLLSLAGQKAIPLDTREFLDSTRASLEALRGRPLVLFFWAHWCSDCKLQGPILEKLQAEFARDGLMVVAPTQRYGYVGARENVPPEEERRHIALVGQEFYPFLKGVPIPLSAENFRNYGVSSTPTIVLVDRDGIVRLYHPGRMTEDVLRQEIRQLVTRPRELRVG